MARNAAKPEPITEEDLDATLERYGQLNPEWRKPLSPRAATELRRNFETARGKPLDEKDVARRRGYVAARVGIVMEQLGGNYAWQTRAKTLKPEVARIAATEDEFRAAPRTFVKTVQEVLTPRTERIAYSRAQAEAMEHDLSNVVIDPDRITPTLLKNLGLDQYLPPKGLSETEKMKHMARAMPQIKEMLRGLEPFTLSRDSARSGMKNFRLMRIKTGKNNGFVLGTQDINGEKTLFKTDLHGAYRRIERIRDNYDEEIAKLQQILEKIAGVDSKVSTDWNEAKKDLEPLKKELLECVDRLKYVSNNHKVAMRNKIERCLDFEEERTVRERHGTLDDGTRGVTRPAKTIKVLNPGAKRAIWNTLDRDVSARLTQIQRIRGYVEQDQVAAKNYIEKHQAPAEKFYDQVETLHDRFAIFTPGHPLSPEDTNKISRNLRELADKTRPSEEVRLPRGLDFQPYTNFGRAMNGHINSTITTLAKPTDGPLFAEPQRSEAATNFMKTYLVAKIQHFYIALQRFYDRFLSPAGTPNFDDVIGGIEELRAMFDDRRVSPEIKTPDFHEIYGRLFHLLKSLRKKARLANSKELTPQDAKELMKEQIKNYPFDALFI